MRCACLALALVAGCASSESPPPLLDAPAGAELGGRDLSSADRGALDGAPSLDRTPDLTGDGRLPDSAGCALGTPDHCGACGKACPPGHDPKGAIRVCLSGGCEIQCLDELYDVDGQVASGCEVEDDLPIHDLAQTARDLGAVSDCGNAVSAQGLLPSDGRVHLKSPNDRANGRADWFKLQIADNGGCVVNASIAVSLAALPSGVSVRGTAYWRCDDGKVLASVSQVGGGGGSLSLEPGTACTWLGDDSGTLFLELRKESGPHTAQGYTLTIEP
jgi:hypothetical protein